MKKDKMKEEKDAVALMGKLFTQMNRKSGSLVSRITYKAKKQDTPTL